MTKKQPIAPKPLANMPASKEGHVTPDDDHSPIAAKTKQRTTLVTRNTGTKKPTPKGKT